MSIDDFLEASEEQSELLEELKKIIEQLEEAPADEQLKERVIGILRRLKILREKLRPLAFEESVGDMALLQEFYRLVGVHDEKEILEELLKHIIKGRIDIPKEEVVSHIREMEEFAKDLESPNEGEG